MAVLSTVGTAVGGGVDETDETADLSAAASAGILRAATLHRNN